MSRPGRRPHPLAKNHHCPRKPLPPTAAFSAEIAAEYPDDPTDEDEGWSPPIAEMIEIEVNIPQSVRH